MAFTWFPGHMRKALRRIEADARLVDLVLLLLDARAPATSRNGFLLPGRALDERRAVLFLLKALRDGRWGPLTLERPVLRRVG